MRTAIYLRLSQDRAGERAGVKRQLEDCRAVIEQRRWTETAVFEDNDTSATKGIRPEYQRLVLEVTKGNLDAIVCWSTDRLWRSVPDQQALSAIAAAKGVVIVAGSQEYAPGDADSDFLATVNAALGARESKIGTKRQNRRQQQQAEDGAHHGGPRAFGYDATRSRIIKREANLIRSAAARILAGESVGSICIEWNRKGIETARGNRWTQKNLRQLLQRPALIGLRTHRGQVIGKAVWEPILDQSTHDRLVALFDARKTGTPPRAARKYLLAGFLKCSKCGATLGGHAEKANGGNKDREVYRCPASALNGCGGTTIRMNRVEDTVTDAIMARLDSKDFAKALKRVQVAAEQGNTDLRATIDALDKDRQQLVTAENDYADSLITAAQLQRVTLRVQHRITGAERRLAVMTPDMPPSVGSMNSKALRRSWGNLTLTERRDIVRALIISIVIMPAARPFNVWNPARVVIDWRL